MRTTWHFEIQQGLGRKNVSLYCKVISTIQSLCPIPIFSPDHKLGVSSHLPFLCRCSPRKHLACHWCSNKKCFSGHCQETSNFLLHARLKTTSSPRCLIQSELAFAYHVTFFRRYRFSLVWMLSEKSGRSLLLRFHMQTYNICLKISKFQKYQNSNRLIFRGWLDQSGAYLLFLSKQHICQI